MTKSSCAISLTCVFLLFFQINNNRKNKNEKKEKTSIQLNLTSFKEKQEVVFLSGSATIQGKETETEPVFAIKSKNHFLVVIAEKDGFSGEKLPKNTEESLTSKLSLEDSQGSLINLLLELEKEISLKKAYENSIE